MPSLQELREEAQKLDNEVLQIRSEHDKLKSEGKTGDDAWGGAEKRKRFRDVMSRRESLRKELQDEQDAADLLAESEEINRRSAGDGGAGRPSGNMNHDQERRGDSRHSDEGGRSLRAARLRSLAFEAWASHGLCDSEERSAACRELRFNPASPSITFDISPTGDYRSMQRLVRHCRHDRIAEMIESHGMGRESRALSAHNGPSGAYAIPSTFVRQLEVNLLAYNGIERLADVMVTETGEEMAWPSVDDTSNSGELLGEARETTSTKDPTFKLTRWNAYEFSSGELLVPRPLLQDAGVALESELTNMLPMRIGRKGAQLFTTGTGNSQPNGIMNIAGLGRTAASATAITGDDLLRLLHSVDPDYRDPQRSAFMMHDSIILEASLLKDGQNNYIWQSGLQTGTPDRIRGFQVVPNQFMDSALAASNKVAVFGDFSRYKIRRVRQVTLTRVVEKYANKNMVAFILIVRQDGNAINAGTNPFKYLKMAAS